MKQIREQAKTIPGSKDYWNKMYRVQQKLLGMWKRILNASFRFLPNDYHIN